MPELPDLTIYARNLRKQVLHRPIKQVDIFHRARVHGSPEAFARAFVGQRLYAVERDGKELFFIAANQASFSVHLMLAGRLSLLAYLEIFSVNSKVLAVGFEDGGALVVSDSLRMAKAALNPQREAVPDALSADFTFAYFQQVVGKKATANIKALLIDQHVVRGIGNAYADEILWRAGISPKSTAGKIPQAELLRLYDAVIWVLDDAIEQIERISPDIIAGEERSFLRVHRPKLKTAPDGEAILCEEIGKKRTYFTGKQKLYL